MKKILAYMLMLLLCMPAYAQIRPRKLPVKKQLQIENEALKLSLDSLQLIIDSLRAVQEEESEISAVLEGNETKMEYTAEVSDSLLHLWYRNSFNGDFYDAVNEYNMDSVKFSSNVSDEEMARRLVAMNSFITLPFNENVKNYIILYSEKMPTKMGRVMGLSSYYFPIFEEVFNKYELPVELKYMAVIESMLNPVATSRAGAKGIWQFMYNTARGYGLNINSFVDERLDVEKAIDAAARYLRDAYKIFGDWSLAISSYNCGAGNVSKAIRRAGGSRDFWSIYPYLPRETRGYVPAFVGAMYAMTYWREYGIVPQNVGMPAQTDTFEIRHNLHFDQVNAIVGVPMEDLQNLNPQYVHSIIPGAEQTYVLKLPYTWTNAFLDADRDSMYRYKADSLLNQKVLKDGGSSSSKGSTSGNRITYKVKSGDYLGKIASRYHVTINQIKNWNHLRSNNLRVGQILYIYSNAPAAAAAPAASKPAATSTAKPAAGSTSTGSSAAKPAASVNGGKTSSYTVKQGDSLYQIAKLYPGVSAENIMKANGLKNANIRAGQKLVIPLP